MVRLTCRNRIVALTALLCVAVLVLCGCGVKTKQRGMLEVSGASNPVWSRRDSRTLYYHKDGKIWRVNTQTGESRVVLFEDCNFDVAPDGRAVVYARGEKRGAYGIFITDFGSGNTRCCYRSKPHALFPMHPPIWLSRNRVLFGSLDGEGATVMVDATGGQLMRIPARMPGIGGVDGSVFVVSGNDRRYVLYDLNRHSRIVLPITSDRVLGLFLLTRRQLLYCTFGPKGSLRLTAMTLDLRTMKSQGIDLPHCWQETSLSCDLSRYCVFHGAKGEWSTTSVSVHTVPAATLRILRRIEGLSDQGRSKRISRRSPTLSLAPRA